MTQGTMVFVMACAALVMALVALGTLVVVLRGGERRFEEGPAPLAPAVPRRMMPVRRVPWNGVAPEPHATGGATRPFGDGPTIGGAGRFRPVTSAVAGVAEPRTTRVQSLGGRLSGQVTFNPEALCTVCGTRLTDCGGHS